MDKQKRLVRGAIVTHYGSQSVASRELGIREHRLSRLLNGHEQFKPAEVAIFRDKLGVVVSGSETSK